jgi:SSS family solute:Na+ symporter
MFSTEHATLFVVGFIIYICIMIWLGWFTTRNKLQGDNYITGGRSLPFFLLLPTICATLIGTGSSMGGAANGFRVGWGAALFGLGSALAMFLIGLFYYRTRDLKINTPAEEAQYYYDGNALVRKLMGFAICIIEVVWLGNHINGGSKYLAYVTGLPEFPAKVITTLAFAIYVFIGGYLAVVWTDFVQFLIIGAGFIAIMVVAIPAAGGYAAIQAAYTAADKAGAANSIYGLEYTGILAGLALFFAQFLSMLATPTYRTRLFTAKDANTAKKSFYLSGVVLFAFSFLPAIIGMAAFTIASREGVTGVLENPDFAFSFMATHVLGPIMGLMFLIAGLSATMSSGDSDAIAGVTILLSDVYPIFTGRKVPDDKYTKYSRVALVIMMLFAFVATMFATDIMSYINNVAGSFMPGIAMTLFMGRFFKRATWQGGAASIISSLLYAALYLGVGPFKSFIMGIFGGPALPAALCSIAVVFIVSLVTKKEEIAKEKCLELVYASRGK